MRFLCKRWKKFGLSSLCLIALLWVGYRARLLVIRPSRTPEITELAPGISYEKRIFSDPRPIVAHILTINLQTDGLEMMVTPPDFPDEQRMYKARTMTQFMDEFGAEVAVNASFFRPFKVITPWSFYPEAGDPVEAIGLTMADGVVVGEVMSQWFPPICFLEKRAIVPADHLCPAGSELAVSGNGFLVVMGQPADFETDNSLINDPYPRTAIGVNEVGDVLTVLIVDGNQGRYSHGMTYPETAGLLVELGVWDAVNLDGGGSTQLGAFGKLLNAPIHGRISMRERPVANHIGFHIKP